MLQVNIPFTTELKEYGDHYGDMSLHEMVDAVGFMDDLDFISFVEISAASDSHAAYLIRSFARALRHFMELDRMSHVPTHEMRGDAFMFLTAQRCDAIDIMDALLKRIVNYAIEPIPETDGPQ